MVEAHQEMGKRTKKKADDARRAQLNALGFRPIKETP